MPFMPYMSGPWDAADRRRPGVNHGKGRGITKSAARKRRSARR